MTRKRYVLKPEEIDALIKGLFERGLDETYKQMKEKATISVEKMKDLDEMFMDMSEDLLVRAREEPQDDDGRTLQKMYYVLNTMLRKLAQEVNILYLKTKGKERITSERFLRLVVSNKEAPYNFITRNGDL